VGARDPRVSGAHTLLSKATSESHWELISGSAFTKGDRPRNLSSKAERQNITQWPSALLLAVRPLNLDVGVQTHKSPPTL